MTIFTHRGLHTAWRQCVASVCPVASIWMKGIYISRMDYDGEFLDRVETQTHPCCTGRFQLKDPSRMMIMGCLHQIAPNARWVHIKTK